MSSKLAEFAAAHNSADLVVRKGGENVVDETFEQPPNPLFARVAGRQDVASVQKSIVSVLIGIAIANGHMKTTDSMRQYLGDPWSPDITIAHMLSMTSGLGPSLETVAPPGERWDYNLTVYPMVKRALTVATGKTLPELTEPLGLSETDWVDRVWNDALPEMLKPAFFYPDGKPMEALHSHARDLATFGELVRTHALPIDPDFAAAMIRPSQRRNPLYGYLWWVRDDGYAALGHGNQCCVVIPSAHLVIARTGADASDTFIDELVALAKEAYA